ncbi:MAG: hypothetical protein JKY34_16295 [Kordiimonadaceae bacterium]|nr:hypothetical protein [Kordiimonadaceae bacterium]
MGLGREASKVKEDEAFKLNEWVEETRKKHFEQPLDTMKQGWHNFRNKMVIDAAEPTPKRDTDDRTMDLANLTDMVSAVRAFADDVESYVTSQS